ncbi:MAG: glycoside hydrolase family 97 protein, partial [Akkermansiaceae bacterium]
MKHTLVIISLALTSGFLLAEDKKEPQVAPVTEQLRKDFKLAQSYKKALILNTFPIVSSDKVRDEAFYESAWIINSMLKNRPDILRELGKNRVRLAIMAWDERTADVPEHSDLKPHAYWNRRARGLGPTPHRPCVSCGEENLLNFPGDPYDDENILVHEFAHAVHDMALKTL